MPFTPKAWQDSPSVATPISAAALIDLENRVTAASVPLASNVGQIIRTVVAAPTGVAATDTSAINTALATVNAGAVYCQAGAYAINATIAISAGVTLVLDPRTTFNISTVGGVDAITLANGSALFGFGYGSNATINITSTANVARVITNADKTGAQEYCYAEGLGITVSSGAVVSVAVVDLVSMFVNSGVQNLVINCNRACALGLRIAGGSNAGTGPVYVKNCWVTNATGDNILLTENNPSKGACQFWLENVTSENQSSGGHGLRIAGFGGINGVRIAGYHYENAQVCASDTRALWIDGASYVTFDDAQLLATNLANKGCVMITNNGLNARHLIRNMSNINNISPTITDVTGAGQTINAQNINEYRGPSGLSGLYGSMIVLNDLRRSAQALVYAATLGFVDARSGEFVDVGALTGPMTVGAPFSPQIGQVLTYSFVQDGTGGRVVTWNAIFKQNWTPNTAAGLRNNITFRYDGTSWVQIGSGIGLPA